MAEPIKEKEEEILEAEIVEEVSLILDNIVFSTFTKNGKTEYKSSALDRKLVVLSPTSHLPEPGRSYQVKVIEDTQPDNPKKGKLIVEIYYGSVEARAQDLTSQINEKMAKLNAKEVAEQTEVELDEVAKLYKEIEALYKSTESAETIEDRGEWLKKFEKKALLEINAIAAKYPNNVKLKDIVKNLCGFDSDEA
ncbi:MAG: hypothetical protein EXS48_02660, partial [Candidatus Staskawiczbacteria bacterium]|nr:hypothetical protein [Candidatus Staskawiczbacteria bacterium]